MKDRDPSADQQLSLGESLGCFVIGMGWFVVALAIVVALGLVLQPRLADDDPARVWIGLFALAVGFGVAAVGGIASARWMRRRRAACVRARSPAMPSEPEAQETARPPIPASLAQESGPAGYAALPPGWVDQHRASDPQIQASPTRMLGIGLAIVTPPFGVILVGLGEPDQPGLWLTLTWFLPCVAAGLLISIDARGLRGAGYAALGGAILSLLVVVMSLQASTPSGAVAPSDDSPLPVIVGAFLGSAIPTESGYVLGRLVAWVVGRRRGPNG